MTLQAKLGPSREGAPIAARVGASDGEPGPQPVRDGANTALRALLRFETAIRKARLESELQMFVANEARGLVRARQIFFVSLDQRRRARIVAISGFPAVDRSVPLVALIEGALTTLGRERLEKRMEFRLSGVAQDAGAAEYPLQEILWAPLVDHGGSVLGGLLFSREIPWIEGDVAVADHIANAAGYAWASLRKARPLRSRFRLTGKLAVALSLAVAALGFWPVSMTVLAPVEIAPQQPYVVASGLDGIIEEILVKPNQAVRQGDVVARLVQVEPRNKLDVAEREMQVAAAKLQKATQLAFSDVRGRHDMGVAQAELDLRVAERDYARDQLALTELKAGRDGVAVFGDRKDLVSRPIAVGDRVMEIADPRSVALQIDVPVGDGLVIKLGGRAKAFLDSDPLRPIEATIDEADYQARMRDGTTMAYRVVANLPAGTGPAPRLGIRGTAQVYGDTVPLWFYLLRRPISAARQWLGI